MESFDNRYYSDKVVTPTNQTTVEFIRSAKCEFIAEFGVLHGATSIEIAKCLNGNGVIHLYDFNYNVEKVVKLIRDLGYNNVEGFGCSSKMLDSYNWPLMKVIEAHPHPIYDYVYLDGAHTWNVDALTFLLCDRLLKVGGYVDFDDYNWSLAISPTLSPSKFPMTKEMYTDEQIETSQVKKIVDLLVRPDKRYVEIVKDKIFQKRLA